GAGGENLHEGECKRRSTGIQEMDPARRLRPGDPGSAAEIKSYLSAPALSQHLHMPAKRLCRPLQIASAPIIIQTRLPLSMSKAYKRKITPIATQNKPLIL